MDASSSFLSYNSLSSDSEIYNVSSPESNPSVERPKPRKTRCKNPSKQRRNASEKEKLRMRDLTKALHYLRTFLPPFVVPAGQTLTKIETLRLAIRYISYLSSQLDLQMSYSQDNQLHALHHSFTSHSWEAENLVNETEAFHFQRNELPDSAFYESWSARNEQTHQPENITPPQTDVISNPGLHAQWHLNLQSGVGCIQVETELRDGIKMEISNCDELFNRGSYSLIKPQTSLSHQGSSKAVQCDSAAHLYWT